ncbi:MAG: hypothetical protein RIB84_08470 [Sneathiellaceae bacterium]
MKDDEDEIRRELLQLYFRTGNDRYRLASMQLRQEPDFLAACAELIERPKPGQPAFDDRDAMLRMALALERGSARSINAAALAEVDKVPGRWPREDNLQHTNARANKARRLRRRFAKEGETWRSLARGFILVERHFQGRDSLAEEVKAALGRQRDWVAQMIAVAEKARKLDELKVSDKTKDAPRRP